MKTPKKPDHLKPNNYKWETYKGISAAECKGPKQIYSGPLYPGQMPWPADLAKFYEDKI